MKMYNYLFCCLTIFTIDNLKAQTINPATTAATFLRIPADVQATGMASTGVATQPMVGAIFYNVGKLPFTKESAALALNYVPWLRHWAPGMYMASVAGYYKVSSDEAICTAINYFKPGDLRFTDDNGNYLQTYNPYEYSLSIGYARKLSHRLGLGLTLKYVRSDLGRGMVESESMKPANAGAADFGLFYNLKNENDEGFSFGAQLSNLGSKISYTTGSNRKSFLPANFSLGTCYTKLIDDQNKISIAIDINKLLVPVAPSDSLALLAYQNKSVVGSWFASFSDASFKDQLKELQISAGVEYWYNNRFALRAGYFYENKNSGNRNYVSTGASIRYSLLTAHFAYLTSTGSSIQSPISNSLLFSLNLTLLK